jgi:hypothetical protein
VLHSRFRGELFDRCAKHPVEGWERMNDVRERLQRCLQLDREHELAHDLAGTRSDQGRADEHAALAVGDQLQRPSVEVMNMASRGLGRIGADDNDVDAFGARGSLRQPDRRDFRIGIGHARHGGVVGRTHRVP